MLLVPKISGMKVIWVMEHMTILYFQQMNLVKVTLWACL